MRNYSWLVPGIDESTISDNDNASNATHLLSLHLGVLFVEIKSCFCFCFRIIW
jgi:hypothetical protein